VTGCHQVIDRSAPELDLSSGAVDQQQWVPRPLDFVDQVNAVVVHQHGAAIPICSVCAD
jgi:hypothetical protein